MATPTPSWAYETVRTHRLLVFDDDVAVPLIDARLAAGELEQLRDALDG